MAYFRVSMGDLWLTNEVDEQKTTFFGDGSPSLSLNFLLDRISLVAPEHFAAKRPRALLSLPILLCILCACMTTVDPTMISNMSMDRRSDICRSARKSDGIQNIFILVKY